MGAGRRSGGPPAPDDPASTPLADDPHDVQTPLAAPDWEVRPQPDEHARLRRRLRRLRVSRAVLALVALLGLATTAATLFYWDRYLLAPSGDPFQRGPFLTRLSSTSASLAFTLRRSASVQLRALAPDGGVVTAQSGVFAGLVPDTRYAWTATINGSVRAAGSFRTAPTSLASPIGFAVIGDYGSGNDHEWAVGRVVASTQPDFVLTAGDNSYLVSLPFMLDRNIFQPLHTVIANAPLWATLGEHDLFFAQGRYTIDALHSPGDGVHYSVTYGPIQVIALGLEADASARAYAAAALRTPGPQVRFILVHRPIQPQNPILPILRAAHVAAILCGHLHRYERRVVGGVEEFTVGTSGMGPGTESNTPRSPDAAISIENYGALRVLVNARAITYTFIDEQGRVLDNTTAPTPAGS